MVQSRISNRFRDLRNAKSKALIAYLTAGDPDLGTTVRIMHCLVSAGATIIELGVPFSDPMADGEVIQRASQRAIAKGTSLVDVLECVSLFREKDSVTPIVLMGYMNPFECMGPSYFAERAKKAGVDGILIVDLPPEEAKEINFACAEQGLDQIFLVAPNTSDRRAIEITRQASGFVYFVSVKGVTGGKGLAVEDIRKRISFVREITDLPVGVGFGIRTTHEAFEVAKISDAVIVGSAIVRIIEEEKNVESLLVQVGEFVQELSLAINRA